MDARAGAEFGIPTLALMENAGAGAARVALERWGSLALEATCVCGPGQNGGDALVVARHLLVAGGRPVAVALAGPGGFAPAGDAAVQLRACRALGIPVREVRTGDEILAAAARMREGGVCVDGLFGTGLTRAIDGVAAALVAAIAGAARPVLALDLPSGLDCDTGLPLGPCVRADVTATFVAPKAGFLRPESRAWTGEVVVVPIGVPAE